MQLQITGINVDVGKTLPPHITQSVKETIKKYFSKAIDARVVIKKSGKMFNTEIHVHVNKYVDIDANGMAGDAYSSFELALEHIAKRLRRKKRMISDKHHDRR
jgi:ribosomal subunit interface protein